MKPREVKKTLKKLGFEHVNGTKHEKWVLRDKKTDTKYATTHVSRGNDDIKHGTMSAIHDQVHLTKAQFEQARKGDLDKKDYWKILSDKGIV